MKKKYTSAYKLNLVKQTFQKRLSIIAKENNVPVNTLRTWQRKFNIYGESAFEIKDIGRRKYGNEKKLRKYHLDIRLNEQEYTFLMKKYMINNYKNSPVSEHFRNILLDKKIEFSEEINPLLLDQYIKIGTALKKYGSNINQIIKNAHIFNNLKQEEKTAIIDNIKKVNSLFVKLEELI